MAVFEEIPSQTPLASLGVRVSKESPRGRERYPRPGSKLPAARWLSTKPSSAKFWYVGLPGWHLKFPVTPIVGAPPKRSDSSSAIDDEPATLPADQPALVVEVCDQVKER